MYKEAIKEIIGETCWHISFGGFTEPSFLLAMGEKVPRQNILRNPDQPEEYRIHRGSVELIVWCTWRLQTTEKVLFTSDQQSGVKGLEMLTGNTVTNANCLIPAWDLEVDFSDGLKLIVFCDHIEPGSSFSDNWELLLPGQHIVNTGKGRLTSIFPDTNVNV